MASMHTAVYIPACLAMSSTIPVLSERIFVLLVLVCNPAVLIIDHGHFQYNGIGLGLTVWCILTVGLLSRRFLKLKIPKCVDWRNFLHCYEEISNWISIILRCTQPQTDDSIFCSSCICPFIRNVLKGKENIGKGRSHNQSPCIRKKPSSHPVEFLQATMLARLGTVVVVSFIICWMPFMGSIEMLQQVIKRIFPLQRGLFEDYVANFW